MIDLENRKMNFFEKIDSFIIKYTKYPKIWSVLTKELPIFIKNIWIFRDSLWNFRWYNMDGTLYFIKDALEYAIPNYQSQSMEWEQTLNLKIYRMKRLKYLLEVHKNNLYTELAENELGKAHHGKITFIPIDETEQYFSMVEDLTEEQKLHNKKVYQKSTEIEKAHWNEIFETLKGYEIVDYNEQFDGNGLNHWWN
jgi:hypothetical protein